MQQNRKLAYCDNGGTMQLQSFTPILMKAMMEIEVGIFMTHHSQWHNYVGLFDTSLDSIIIYASI